VKPNGVKKAKVMTMKDGKMQEVDIADVPDEVKQAIKNQLGL